MKFRNDTDKDLAFKLHGVAYAVPCGSECDIPDKVAYCVKLHGLPLTELAAELVPYKPVGLHDPEICTNVVPAVEAPKKRKK